jgi:hypothetical protein
VFNLKDHARFGLDSRSPEDQNFPTRSNPEMMFPNIRDATAPLKENFETAKYPKVTEKRPGTVLATNSEDIFLCAYKAVVRIVPAAEKQADPIIHGRYDEWDTYSLLESNSTIFSCQKALNKIGTISAGDMINSARVAYVEDEPFDSCSNE